MFFSIASSLLLGSVAGYGYLKTNGLTNDADKIQRIFANAGWVGKEKGEMKTIRLRRRRKIENGMEYVYQLPYGFDRKKVADHIHILEDGLNTKKIAFDIKELKFDKNILKQIKELKKDKKCQKKIELDFDGMLKIRVFEKDIGKVEWNDNLLKKGTWSIPIGKTQNGKTIYHDFDKRKSIIIAGAPGFGKSVTMKMFITSLTMSNPDDVTFSLIDLKLGPAFKRFENMKQIENFGKTASEATDILEKVQKRMESDYIKIIDDGFEDVTEAGIKKRHFLIIDEGADLISDPKAIELLTDIVRKGRGAGYYVIYSTQYPTAQTVPMQVKRNIPARLCFVLDSSTASMAVLDGGGAEKLPEIPGRGIYKNVKQMIIQTPFMSNEQIKERIKPYEEERHELPCPTPTESRKHSLITEKA
jgi:DNA segregation ATPase FtsK/SpoIIIE, S-DNA-T family